MIAPALLSLALAVALAPASPAPASPPEPAPRPASSATRNSAQGRLRSAGERQPLAGARIFATARRGPAWTREAVSAADGTFLLTDLPALDFTLVVVAPGHARFEQPTTPAFWRRRRPPTIYLQPTEAGRYRTVVAQERSPKPTPFQVQLNPEEIAGLPGSQGDPLRALQNLPGSARIPGGLGLIVLRGASPNQSQVFVGEHPVPRAFHVPGLASVVPAAVLSGLDYIPGNFAPNYGNAVGGLVVLRPRVGRRDGLHGHAKLDIISAGALVEGPVGRGSFLIAAQRGYLDLALRALGSEILGPSFIRPKYSDYQVVFDQPVGQGASLTARILGAGDDLRYRAGGWGPAVSLTSVFHRIDLVYRKRHGPWDFMLSPALRLDRSGLETDDQIRRRDDVVGLLRGELTVRPARRFQLTVGADTQLDRHRTLTHVGEDHFWLPPQDDLARGFTTSSGAYLTPLLSLGTFTLSPGLRVSLFTGPGDPKFSVDPRLHARWAPHSRVAVQIGAGRYAQAIFATPPVPGFGLVGPLDSLGIPDTIVLPAAVRYLDPRLEFHPDSRLGMSQAIQLSASIHLELTRALGLDATFFWRRVRLGAPPEVLPSDSGSLTHGLEAMLRHQLTHRLFGWIAYTWMRSRVGGITVGTDELVLRYPADFDQRHNLVALLGYKLPRRWQIGARFRLVTGLPVTPIVGGIKTDGTSSNTQPLPGETNSARMPIFHQLDVRIDKTWVRPRSIISAYLDVQNLYNRQNAEGLWYLHDYSATRTVVGVPILPVLGVRVDY